MACGAAAGMPARGVKEVGCSQPGYFTTSNAPQLLIPADPEAELRESARTVADRRVTGAHQQVMIRRHDGPIESPHGKRRIAVPGRATVKLRIPAFAGMTRGRARMTTEDPPEPHKTT